MNSIVYDKAFYFSVRVYNLFKYLNEDKKEFIMAKQILKSGTSIGAIYVAIKILHFLDAKFHCLIGSSLGILKLKKCT